MGFKGTLGKSFAEFFHGGRQLERKMLVRESGSASLTVCGLNKEPQLSYLEVAAAAPFAPERRFLSSIETNQ